MEPDLFLAACLFWGVFCLWLAVAGAAAGSFLECVVRRRLQGEKWHKGRSRCDSCGHVLGPLDLVPVIGYLVHKGRCRYCGERIPAECLAAETAGAAAFVCMGLRFGLVLELGQWLVLAALLLAAALTDNACRIIPNGALGLMALNRGVWLAVLGQPLWETCMEILPGLAVPGVLLLLVLLMEKLLGREAMGGGDIKLLFALALYLSWEELLLGLLTACLLGLGAAAAKGRGKGEAVPFGPYLAVGTVLVKCFGEPLLHWYKGLF